MSSQVIFDQAIFEAKTTGAFLVPLSSTDPPWLDGKMTGGALEFTFHVLFGASTSAGVIKVETSHDPAFSGTWATIATVTWATANTAHYVSLTGCFRALRLRISTDIVGGTASAYCIASTR